MPAFASFVRYFQPKLLRFPSMGYFRSLFSTRAYTSKKRSHLRPNTFNRVDSPIH